MRMFYRFRHATQWYEFECPGLIQRDVFLKCLQEKHKVPRILMEDPVEYIRPWTRIVVRRVPPHWKPQPKIENKTPNEPEAATILYDIDAEFGPDPYTAEPSKPAAKPAKAPKPLGTSTQRRTPRPHPYWHMLYPSFTPMYWHTPFYYQ
jgi:hypothetical protein